MWSFSSRLPSIQEVRCRELGCGTGRVLLTQWVAFILGMIGFSLMVASWTVLILLMVRIIMNHFRILGEELALELQYGESCLDYKNSVPRCFVFF